MKDELGGKIMKEFIALTQRRTAISQIMNVSKI